MSLGMHRRFGRCTLSRMKYLAAFALLAVVVGCSSSNPRPPQCFCDPEEKFDGTSCVAAADFVAPTCEADDVAVCGCDGAAYTSDCAAFTVGVQVQYAGVCRADAYDGTSGSGGGGGFGW